MDPTDALGSEDAEGNIIRHATSSSTTGSVAGYQWSEEAFP